MVVFFYLFKVLTTTNKLALTIYIIDVAKKMSIMLRFQHSH